MRNPFENFTSRVHDMSSALYYIDRTDEVATVDGNLGRIVSTDIFHGIIEIQTIGGEIFKYEGRNVVEPLESIFNASHTVSKKIKEPSFEI